MGRESPAELKAAKLARGRARGLEDRGLKPNTAEREAIEAVIKAPPNRCALRTICMAKCPGAHAHYLCHAVWKCAVLQLPGTSPAPIPPLCVLTACIALVGTRDLFMPGLLRAAC